MGWDNEKVAQNGAMSGALWENYLVSEIVKTYLNSGKDTRLLFFYRDRNQKEIDLIIQHRDALYPIEIKYTTHPKPEMGKNFSVLKDTDLCRIQNGTIVCQCDKPYWLSDTLQPGCTSNDQCPADKPVCEQGKCTEKSECEDKTKILCNDRCIDPLTDNNHCGSCGNPCHKDEKCIEGYCVVNCDYYQLARCENNDECVDLSSDAFNCGSCGEKCKPGEECVDSTCTKIEPCETPKEMECVDQNTRRICGENKQWLYAPCSDDTTCFGGECILSCTPGDKKCTGDVAEICNSDGIWTSAECSGNKPFCNDGECVVCTPGEKKCSGDIAKTCSSAGTWTSQTCTGNKPICSDGECVAKETTCTDGDKKCNGKSVQSCNNGQWKTTKTCSGSTPVCSDGECTCDEGTVNCSDDHTLSTCVNGTWNSSTCPNETPICSNDQCVCTEGESRCLDGKTLQTCINGIWGSSTCTGTTPVCSDGQCVECANGSTKCSNNKTLQTCVNGVWSTSTCSDSKPVCSDGQCVECANGSTRCQDDNTIQTCINGVWNTSICLDSTPVCNNGQCINDEESCDSNYLNSCENENTIKFCNQQDNVATAACNQCFVNTQTNDYCCDGNNEPCGGCNEGNKQCSGNTVLTCTNNEWKTTQTCSGDTPVCSNGLCINNENNCDPYTNPITCLDGNTVQYCNYDKKLVSEICNQCFVNTETTMFCCDGNNANCGGCNEGNTQCSGNTVLTCVNNAWKTMQTCSGNTPVCIDGECTTGCEGNLVVCGGQCIDLSSDPDNCGTCGKKCDISKNEKCVQGTCANACEGNLVICGGQCIDLSSDLVIGI